MYQDTKLIFLIGAAGAGKSTVGKLVAAKFHFCYLDKDIVSNRFTGAMLTREGYAPTERDECQYYKDVVYQLEYQSLLNIASDNLKLGNSVLLDAPFLGYFQEADYVEKFMQEYQLEGITPYVLRVYVSEDVLKQRMIERNNERDTWKLENWDEFYVSVKSKICKWNGVKHVEYDNSNSPIDEAKLFKALDLA